MKTLLKVFAAILVVVGVILYLAYQDQRERMATHAQETADGQARFKSFSMLCRDAFARRGNVQVLDWRGISGPWETSTGNQFKGQADLGAQSVDVTCYFNTHNQILQITTENTPKRLY